MRATLRNILTGEVLRVRATTDHPCSSYGQEVWVDEENNCIGTVGVPLLGYTIIG